MVDMQRTDVRNTSLAFSVCGCAIICVFRGLFGFSSSRGRCIYVPSMSVRFGRVSESVTWFVPLGSLELRFHTRLGAVRVGGEEGVVVVVVVELVGVVVVVDCTALVVQW